MMSDRPVSLSALALFEWDDFGVVVEAAGEGMANCGQAGFLPCDASLQPERGTPVQVLGKRSQHTTATPHRPGKHIGRRHTSCFGSNAHKEIRKLSDLAI